MNAAVAIPDPIVAAFVAAHEARQVYPTGHVVTMTRDVDDRSRAISVATCECGAVIRLLVTKTVEMDAAIEQHWQRSEPKKREGRPALPDPLSPEQITESAEVGAAGADEDDEWMLEAAAKLAWRREMASADRKREAPPAPERLGPAVTLYCGDCRNAISALQSGSVDACLTDPPYHLTANKKGGSGIASVNLDSPFGRARIGTGNGGGGFMGKAWDGGDVAFQPDTWREIWRVLKPGAHLLAFGGTRTYHRMVCAIEDAGFEIRDCIQWLYGSGFPKSLDISKAIDKAAGAERKVVGEGVPVRRMIPGADQNVFGWEKDDGRVFVPTMSEPATDAARQWEGWGTALKPACELIVLARKPLSESTIAANVLKWGTGALNIDGCRVGTDGGCAGAGAGAVVFGDGLNGTFAKPVPGMGRWPANLCHDGSEEVVAGFPESNSTASQKIIAEPNYKNAVYGRGMGGTVSPDNQYSDDGSTARFFYTAKADSDDRLGSKHPTVKPVDLMQYLVRLVTPPLGTVLDPFAGTGTTGEACIREGMRAVLIEREAEYQDDIRRRMKLCLAGPDERARESIKARMKDKPEDHGPLFGGTDKDVRGGASTRADGARANSSSLSTQSHDRPDRIEVVSE